VTKYAYSVGVTEGIEIITDAGWVDKGSNIASESGRKSLVKIRRLMWTQYSGSTPLSGVHLHCTPSVMWHRLQSLDGTRCAVLQIPDFFPAFVALRL